MADLESDFHGIDPSEVSYRPTANRYGLIGGLVLIVIGLLTYLLGLVDYTGGSSNMLANVLTYGIMIATIAMAIKTHRDNDLDKFITLGRGFKTGAWVSLILGLLTLVWTFLFFSFIAPEVLELIENNAIAQMEEQGNSEEEIEAALPYVTMFMSPGAMAVMASFFTFIAGAIISIIAAAILKKER